LLPPKTSESLKAASSFGNKHEIKYIKGYINSQISIPPVFIETVVKPSLGRYGGV